MTDKEWKQFIRNLWRLTDDRTMEELKNIERRYFSEETTDEQIEKEIAETIDSGVRRHLTKDIREAFIDGFVDFLQKEGKL